MLERNYQAGLIHRIKKIFPGSIVLKTDPDYIQGFPDLLILCGQRWAALEVKRSADAHRQPNQEHYISVMNEMGCAYFICPENESEVLDEIQRSFGITGTACFPECEQLPLA